MQRMQPSQKKAIPTSIYEQMSINEIINPNAPKIGETISSSFGNLKASQSVKCLSNYVSLFAVKEKRKVLKEQSKYMKNVVKSVHGGLLKYARRNSKLVGNLVGDPKAQRQWKLLGKSIGTTKWNNQEVRLDCKYNVPLAIKYSNLKEAEYQNQKKQMKSLEKQKEPRKMQPLVNKMHILLKKISQRFSPEAQKTALNRSQNQLFVDSISQNMILQSTQISFQNSPCLSPHRKSSYCRRRYKFEDIESNCCKTAEDSILKKELNSTFHVSYRKQNHTNIQKKRIKVDKISGTLPY